MNSPSSKSGRHPGNCVDQKPRDDCRADRRYSQRQVFRYLRRRVCCSAELLNDRPTPVPFKVVRICKVLRFPFLFERFVLQVPPVPVARERQFRMLGDFFAEIGVIPASLLNGAKRLYLCPCSPGSGDDRQYDGKTANSEVLTSEGLHLGRARYSVRSPNIAKAPSAHFAERNLS